jgi:hypothetical protein
VIHEDAAHDASRHCEEMRPVLPLDVCAFDQPQIRLVDENRCLEAVTRALSRHAAPRDPMQFPVDERNQSLEGTLVALPPFEKEPGDPREVLRNAPS